MPRPLVPPSEQRKIFGHPVGLFVLFFTEMWERMSYYGMRALLVLYMTKFLFVTERTTYSVGTPVIVHGDPGATLGLGAVRGLLESAFGPLSVQQLSSQIYGLYTGFVYFTPFFGGIVADRVLGQRKTVVIGALLMATGHFLMAFEQLFFVALFFLVLGNGAFKPNISTQVGSLYPQGDPRRDGAFTIFYMGINLGAFLSPLVCGTLGQTLGWHWGFGAAGVGMLAGLCVYLFGQPYIPIDLKGRAESAKAPDTPKAKLTKSEWERIGALVILCALNIVFWGVYEQQGNTLQLWADQRTDWHLLPGVSWRVPSTWFQAFNPAMIFLFAPVLDRVWRWQAASNKEPASVTKMGIGCMLVGSAFLVMIAAANVVPEKSLASVWWLAGTTCLLTIGELYLSPVGLSLVTKVAPPRIVSMLMGMWFLSSFFGNYLSGFLGTFWERMPKDAFFLMLTGLAVAAGFAMLAMKKPLSKALQEKKAT
jgi:POT family proton-dependent oligopeptide transporter